MPIATHTGRRSSGVYYMRFRVPKDLISTVGKPQILYSLRTKDAKEAKRLSFLHSYNMETYFNDLRSARYKKMLVETLQPASKLEMTSQSLSASSGEPQVLSLPPVVVDEEDFVVRKAM